MTTAELRTVATLLAGRLECLQGLQRWIQGEVQRAHRDWMKADADALAAELREEKR